MNRTLLPMSPAMAFGALALAACLSCPLQGLAQGRAAEKKLEYETFPTVKCTLVVGTLPKEAELIGRTKDGNLVTKINFQVVPIETIVVTAVEFAVDYVDDTVEVALREDRHLDAANLLVEAYKLAVPFIDLPNNNAAEPLLNAGSYFLAAAEKETMRTGVVSVTPEAKKSYEYAYRVYRSLVKATWFPGSRIAEVKSLYCLLRMGRADVVEKAIEEVAEPDHGDAAFGIYWMLKAALFYEKKLFRESIEAAVRSLAFETKDLDSFPGALFLSGQCYEDMMEYHRTRDVYYEVAKLFQRTDIGEISFNRLRFVMDQGFTKKEEDKSIEKVFFDSYEDMNKVSDEFIAAKLEEDRLRKQQEELKKKQEETEAKIAP